MRAKHQPQSVPALPVSRGNSRDRPRKPAVQHKFRQPRSVFFGLQHQVSGCGPFSCPYPRPLPWGTEPGNPSAPVRSPDARASHRQGQGPELAPSHSCLSHCSPSTFPSQAPPENRPAEQSFISITILVNYQQKSTEGLVGAKGRYKRPQCKASGSTEQEGGVAPWTGQEWTSEAAEAANSLSWVTYWAEVRFGPMRVSEGRWAQYKAKPKAEVTCQEPSWLSHREGSRGSSEQGCQLGLANAPQCQGTGRDGA